MISTRKLSIILVVTVETVNNRASFLIIVIGPGGWYACKIDVLFSRAFFVRRPCQENGNVSKINLAELKTRKQ